MKGACIIFAGGIVWRVSTWPAERLEAAGGDVVVRVRRGMPHVFCVVGMLKAASEALDIAGAFIR
jgi:hypothetical protein